MVNGAITVSSRYGHFTLAPLKNAYNTQFLHHLDEKVAWITQTIFTWHTVDLGEGTWQQKLPLQLAAVFSRPYTWYEIVPQWRRGWGRGQCICATVWHLSPVALPQSSRCDTITQGEKGIWFRTFGRAHSPGFLLLVCIHWIELTWIVWNYFRGYRNNYNLCTHLSMENVPRSTAGWWWLQSESW